MNLRAVMVAPEFVLAERECAMATNDIGTLDRLFRLSPHTSHCGKLKNGSSRSVPTSRRRTSNSAADAVNDQINPIGEINSSD